MLFALRVIKSQPFCNSWKLVQHWSVSELPAKFKRCLGGASQSHTILGWPLFWHPSFCAELTDSGARGSKLPNLVRRSYPSSLTVIGGADVVLVVDVIGAANSQHILFTAIEEFATGIITRLIPFWILLRVVTEIPWSATTPSSTSNVLCVWLSLLTFCLHARYKMGRLTLLVAFLAGLLVIGNAGTVLGWAYIILAPYLADWLIYSMRTVIVGALSMGR